LKKAACGRGTPHVGANEPNHQIQPLCLSTTHSLSPSISKLCLFSVIDATPSCHFTWVACVPHHHLSHAFFCIQCSHAHSLATPTYVGPLGDACATSPPFAHARLRATLPLTFISTFTHPCSCTHADLSRFSYIHSGVHFLVRAHRFTHIRHGLAFNPKHHTSALSGIFSQCFAVPLSVYGRHHCLC
jgi:hypothetical protein